jgi:hypothetical protein
LHKPCLGLSAAEMLEYVQTRRGDHVARVRSHLAAKYPDVLAVLDRYMPAARTLNRAEMQPFRLGMHCAEARALAAQLLAWDPAIAYGEQSRRGFRRFSPSRFATLGLFGTPYENRFEPFRRFALEAPHRCERCGAEGELWVATPTGEGGSGFRCRSCDHVDGVDRDGRRAGCCCTPCQLERDAARIAFQRELWPRARDAIERRLRDQVLPRAGGGDGPPPKLQMERDWLMQRSALSRVEAEVLALRPESPEDLFRLADELEDQRRDQGRRRTVSRAELVRRFIEHRVLYRVRVTEAGTTAPESLLIAYLTENARLDFRRSDGRRDGLSSGCDWFGVGREASRVLAEAGDAEFWPALEERWLIRGTAPVSVITGEPRLEGSAAASGAGALDGARVDWSVSACWLESPTLMNPERGRRVPTEALLLNPFAASFSEAVTTRAAASRQVVPAARKKVIASPAEEAELIRLQARFPKHLIVPQLALVTAIDFDALAGYLPPEALSYLRWSRVDFGVLDRDTHEAVRVIEVQVGAHHDSLAQERKDRWKREACAFTGIEFEEVM